jgi:hypothetical protein
MRESFSRKSRREETIWAISFLYNNSHLNRLADVCRNSIKFYSLINIASFSSQAKKLQLSL